MDGWMEGGREEGRKERRKEIILMLTTSIGLLRAYSCRTNNLTLNCTSFALSPVTASLENSTMVFPSFSLAFVRSKFCFASFDGFVVVVLQ